MIDFATNECSKKIEFYCDHEEADTKMFPYVRLYYMLAFKQSSIKEKNH